MVPPYIWMRLTDTLHISVNDEGNDTLPDMERTVALFEPSAAERQVIKVLITSPQVER
jgi:hypothetical protein